MPTNDDLWPQNLNLEAGPTPLSILRTQASLLADKTQGVLEGAVETWSAGPDIYHRFDIVVPALGRYRYELFKVHHSPTLYPVVVDEVPPPAPAATAPPPFVPLSAAEVMDRMLAPRAPVVALRDEAAFREWLRQTLASEQTQRIISSLYGQAVAA